MKKYLKPTLHMEDLALVKVITACDTQVQPWSYDPSEGVPPAWEGHEDEWWAYVDSGGPYAGGKYLADWDDSTIPPTPIYNFTSEMQCNSQYLYSCYHGPDDVINMFNS